MSFYELTLTRLTPERYQMSFSLFSSPVTGGTVNLNEYRTKGHTCFQLESIDSEAVIRTLKKLKYKSICGSENFETNLIEVSEDPTWIIKHPYFLPKPLKILYFSMRESIKPIAEQEGFSINLKDIRLIINRCKKGYKQEWHQDNDGETSLVTLAFFTDGDRPTVEDGGQFQVRRSPFAPPFKDNIILGSHLPINGHCIALDTSTDKFEHRGEEWLSNNKTRYFIRMAFRKNAN